MSSVFPFGVLRAYGHADILLHQSGHIMLSDFDLAKQSSEPGGQPAMILQSEPNGVNKITNPCFSELTACFVRC